MLGALAGLAYNTGSATVLPYALERVTHLLICNVVIIIPTYMGSARNQRDRACQVPSSWEVLDKSYAGEKQQASSLPGSLYSEVNRPLWGLAGRRRGWGARAARFVLMRLFRVPRDLAAGQRGWQAGGSEKTR